MSLTKFINKSSGTTVYPSAPKKGGNQSFTKKISKVLGQTSATSQLNTRSRPRVHPDLTLILSTLARLMRSGLPLSKALNTMSRESSFRKSVDLLQSLNHHVESGESLSSALERQGGEIPELTIALVRAAEMSGNLVSTLNRIAEQRTRSKKLRETIIESLTYPAIVSIAGAFAVFILLTFVVPVFQETYGKSGVALPLPTQILIVAGNFMSSYWWVIFGLVGLMVGVGSVLGRLPQYRLWWDRTQLQIPVIGSLLRSMALCRFSQAMADLVSSGISIPDALDMSRRVATNLSVKETIENIRSSVVVGQTISDSISGKNNVFTPTVLQMIRMGEKTGKLGPALCEVQEMLEESFEAQMKKVAAFVGPAVTLILSAVIGGIAVSIYLPMFDMMKVISH